MEVGERLTQLRVKRNLSQGDIEQKTGLLRCYISRVENGHTVPSVETLEKFAGAFGVPLYRLFYDGAVPKGIALKNTPEKKVEDAADMGALRKHLAKMSEKDRTTLLRMANSMARRRKR